MLLSFALLLPAQTAAPALASYQLKRWLAAFDGSDWGAYLAFVQQNFATPPEAMYRNQGFRAMTGGFDMKTIEKDSPTQVTAQLRDRNSGGTARIVIELDPADLRRIVKLQMQPILPDHLPEKDLLAQTREYVQEQASGDRFSGVVLIAKNGTPVFEQAYGLADREHRIPNAINTRFGMESMGKMFTGVATLQLVQSGKLKLDEPIATYLTDYPNKELASKVTIRQLLTHTGGTGDVFGPELDEHRLELHTHGDYVRLFGTRPLRFEPGTRWEYSNYGFVILGALIDRVSGENYYDYVHDHVFKPAGMTETRFPSEGEPEPGRSVEYAKQGTTWHRSSSLSGPTRGFAAGGASTTADDLLRFANAVQENKLLDARNTEQLTTGHVSTTNGGHYAFGFEDGVLNGLRCFGHSGGAPAGSGQLSICPTAGYTVIVLANMGSPAAQSVANFIVNRLPQPASEHH